MGTTPIARNGRRHWAGEKEAREDGRHAVLLAKGESIVKEPATVSRASFRCRRDVLPLRVTRHHRRQAVVGGGVAGGFVTSVGVRAFGRRGLRSNSTSFSARLP